MQALTNDGLDRSYNVRIPVRDGAHIAADITFPAVLPAPVVYAHTPYGKSTPRAAELAATYAQGGYVFVLSDVRGRGDSDGDRFVPYRRDGQDGADVIGWLAEQPWCTGDVASWGGSYLARIQWLIALEQPPALRAMVVQVCPSDPHVEWPTGTQTLMLINWLSMTDGRALQPRPATDWERVYRHLPLVEMDEAAGFRSEEWRRDLLHTTYDDHWREISYQQRFDELDLPVLHITGWYDDEEVGTPRNFLGMSQHARSERARRAQRLLVGPWGHAVNAGRALGRVDFGDEAVIDQRGRELQFLDHHVKGVQNGEDATAAVRIFVMGANEWRDEPSWPPPYVRETPFHLGGGGELTADPAAGAPSTLWTHDPFDPVPFITELSSGQLGGPDDYAEIEQRPDVLVFSSAELTEPVDAIGPVRLRAFVSTSARDTDVVARLVDLHPDGFAQRLCEGICRLRYRAGMEQALEVVPDEVYEVEVDMWDTSHRFLPGHRIRVEVMSSAFPKYDRNLGTGGDMVTEVDGVQARNTLWHSAARPTRLLLLTGGTD